MSRWDILIQDPEIKIQKSRSRNQDPEIKVQKSRSRNQDQEIKIRKSRSLILN